VIGFFEQVIVGVVDKNGGAEGTAIADHTLYAAAIEVD
jgi:hypothetical protein